MVALATFSLAAGKVAAALAVRIVTRCERCRGMLRIVDRRIVGGSLSDTLRCETCAAFYARVDGGELEGLQL